jgi:D-alanyl-D-alanine carboxypeptidase
MRPGSLFAIASTTKTVTATLAMALAERGKLDLDAHVADALPGLPGADRITPRQLMSHSSGLSNYFRDGYVARTARRHPFHDWTRPEVLSHVRRVNFRPGSRHSYSNSGYVALGGVIEHAGGESIEHLFRRFVARPLGLERSTFRYRVAPEGAFAHPLSGGRTSGYEDRFGARGRIHSDYWGEVWTDGGLATSAAGLAEIGNGVYAGDLLSARSVRAMLPPKRGGWGLGTFDRQACGRRWIGHDGSYGGYQTENWTDRRRRLTVVGAGMGSVAPKVWRAVARAYVG